MRQNYLITTLFRAAIAVPVLFFAIIGCHKKVSTTPETPLQVEEITSTNDPSQPVITIPADKTLLPTKSTYNFVFDWETAVHMPVVPGQPVVPVPWSDQAVRNYDPGLRYDFKKSDGWELVYNNFSDNVNYDTRIFILYNKFRGLFRYYCYNPAPSNPSVDSYRSLINEISLASVSSVNTPLLNYAGQHIIDLNTNASSASLIEPWPLTLGGWYIAQFEMAYDRNISSYNFQQLGLSWAFDFARVEEMSLNDVAASNKMVYLQKQGVRFTNDNARGFPVTGNMQLQVKSMNSLDNLNSIFSGQVIDKLKQTVIDTVAGNMLNATLVPSQGMVDCKLDVPGIIRTDYNLVGFVAGMGIGIPGMDHSKVVGFGPVFNEPVGIFYLASKPVIHVAKLTGAFSEQYTLDVPSIAYVINPFIQNYADVRNFRQEIVAIDAKETKNLTEARIYRGIILKTSAPLTILGVRVSFEVVPKNGSAPVKIVKTFKANVKNS